MISENISLKKEQQSSFDIAVKHLRNKVKDGDISLEGNQAHNRGVVRLARIPHGFYEDEMRQYFSQFGKVTRVRLARSRKTGNSKGFAFIEFLIPEVAKVVAETMNNYLMFDHILKATYIPPEDQKFNYFLGVSKNKVPGMKERKLKVTMNHRNLNKQQGEKFYRRLNKKLENQLNKIRELGIEYDFKPVHNSRPQKAVLTLDESDEEITFKIPQNVEVIKRETTNKAVGKKVCMSSKMEEGSTESIQKYPASTKVISQKPLKVKNLGGHSKLHNSETKFMKNDRLRGIKKQKSLKDSSKTKVFDKKKIRDSLKYSIGEVKSSSNLKSMWQVKESL